MLEYLFILILKVKKELDQKKEWYDDHKILELCKKELIQVATFDFAVMVSLNIRDEQTKQNLLDIYYNVKPQRFRSYCDNMIEKWEGIQKSVSLHIYSNIRGHQL